MDLASLGADVITSRMLRNSARGALNNLDSLPTGMPKADYDELVDSLKKLAGVTKKISWLKYNFFRWGEDWVTIYNAQNLTNRKADGFFTILCHGTEKRIIIDNFRYKAIDLAEKLKSSNYNGEPIRLVSCNTGAKNTGFAQQLSNIMRVEVTAPTNKIRVDKNGEFIISNKGVFKTFKPE